MSGTGLAAVMLMVFTVMLVMSLLAADRNLSVLPGCQLSSASGSTTSSQFYYRLLDH